LHPFKHIIKYTYFLVYLDYNNYKDDMKNGKDFINRVVKKMGYNPSDYTTVEGNVYDEVKEDVLNGLDEGMVFLIGACVPDSPANQIAKSYHELGNRSVITCDVDNGVTIIVACVDDSEKIEGVNIQPLGVINAFLNSLTKLDVAPKESIKEVESKEEDVERISLKDYYRLCLPDNKIGRKSEATLIKELEEANFKVQ
jgi:hypothetical protein